MLTRIAANLVVSKEYGCHTDIVSVKDATSKRVCVPTMELFVTPIIATDHSCTPKFL